MWKRFFITLFIFILFNTLLSIESTSFASTADDNSQSFTLNGTLTQSGTNSPLYDNNVKMVIQILNPDKNCLLYEEQQIISVGADGFFSIQVGSPRGSTKRTSSDLNHTMSNIFQNSVMILANNALTTSLPTSPYASCLGGIYIPNAGDTRYIRILVTPSSTNITDVLSPDIAMNSTPIAMVAQSIQGLEKNKILQVNELINNRLNQTNLEWLFKNTTFASLQSLLAGQMITPPGGGLPLPTSTPTLPSTGAIWYDTASNKIQYWDGSSVITLNQSGVVADGNSITSGTINGSTAIQTSGNIMTSGNLTAGIVTSGTINVSNVNTYNLASTNLATSSLYTPIIYGGTLSGGSLVIDSTTNNTKGNILLVPSTGTINGNVGIGTTSPKSRLHITTPSFTTALIAQSIGVTNGTADPPANSYWLNKPPILSVVGGNSTTNAAAVLGIIAPSSSTSLPPTLDFATTRSSVAELNAGTYTPTNGGQTLGTVAFGGDSGVNLRSVGASISAVANSNWSSTSTSADLVFGTVASGTIGALYTGGISERMRIKSSGNIGIGVSAPTALLQLKAGTSSPNTAPLKLTAGTNLTAPEAGAIEYDGTNLYYTDDSLTRHSISTGTGSSSGGGSNFTNVDTISNGTGSITLSPISTGTVFITSTAVSVGTNSGALVVNGGIGAAGDIYAGASINAATTITSGSTIAAQQLSAVNGLNLTGAQSFVYATKKGYTNGTFASGAGWYRIGTSGAAGGWEDSGLVHFRAYDNSGGTSPKEVVFYYQLDKSSTHNAFVNIIMQTVYNGNPVTEMRFSSDGAGTGYLDFNLGANAATTYINIWQEAIYSGGGYTWSSTPSFNPTPGTYIDQDLMINKVGQQVGGNLYVSKNIGIGTTVPLTNLHVTSATTYATSLTSGNQYGTSQVSAGTAGGAYVSGFMQADVAGAVYLGSLTNHPVKIMTNNVDTRLYIKTDGNIGIGTTSPNSALDVNGSISLSGNTALWQDATNFNTSVGQTTLSANVTAGSGTNGQMLTAIGYQALNVNTTGQRSTAVGYRALSNQTNSGYNVAVGDFSLTSLNVAFSNTAIGSSALSNTTNGAANTGVGYNVLIKNTTGKNNTAIGSSAGGYFGSTGGVTTGSFNTIIGSMVGSGTLATGSNNILIGTSAAVDTPTSSTSNFLNIGNTIYGDLASGNVGIGTTTPATKLDVNGTIRIGNGNESCSSSYTGAIIYNGGNLQFCNGSSWATISTGTGGGGGGSNIFSGNITVGTSLLLANGTDTTKTIALGGDASRSIAMDRNSSGTGKTLTVSAGGSQSGLTDSSGGNLILAGGVSTGTGTSQIQFQTAGGVSTGTADSAPSTKMTILGNGNVGIGETTPTSLLSIGGNVNIGGFGLAVKGSGYNEGTIALQNTNGGGYSGANIYDSNGVLAASFQYGNSGVGPLLSNNFFFGNRGTGKTYIVAGGSATPVVTVLNNGNFGIGQTNPNSKLEIVGSSNDSSTSSLNVTTATGTSILFARNDGFVGIGTTTPATKLDVNGTIRIGNGNETCSSSYTGAIIYNGGNLQFCNGSSWATISTGTGGGGGSYLSTTGGTVNGDSYFTGKVGIGTTSPTFTLDVSGSIHSTGGIQGGGQIQVNGTNGTFSWGGDNYLTRAGTANLHFGLVDSATPVAQTLGVQNVAAGNTDTAGANWTFTGSQGTGTGNGGSILFQTAPAAGSSGSTQNALATAMSIGGNGYVGIGTASASYPFNIVNTNTNTAAGQNIISYLNGKVNVGTASSADYWSTYSIMNTTSGGANITGGLRGGEFIAGHYGNSSTLANTYALVGATSNYSTGTITSANGGYFTANNSSTGLINNATAVFGNVLNNTTGTIGTARGGYFRIQNNGTINNAYGIYIDGIAGSTNNKWSLYAYDAAAPSYFAGSVGIGTTSPAATLHSFSTTEQLRIGYDNNNYSSFKTTNIGDLYIRNNSGGGGGSTYFATYGPSNSTIIFNGGNIKVNSGSDSSFTGNGNVGIGTSTPNASYKLDVAGAINAQSIYVNGTLLSSWTGGGGGVNAGFSGLTGATATDTIDNANFAQTWNWSSATSQTPLTVTANSLSTGNLLSLSSTSSALNSASGLLSVANLSASTLGTVARIQSNSTADSGLTVLANGNVGIGTTSPQYNLDVSGVGQFQTNNSIRAGIIVKDSSGVQQLKIYTGNSIAPDLTIPSIRGHNSNLFFNSKTGGSVTIGNDTNTNFVVNQNQLYVSNTGNVGIGTTSPIATFEVAGGGRFSGSIGAFGGIDMQHSNIIRVDSLSTDSPNGMLFNASSASGLYKFQVTGIEKMRIDSSGNIGFGTINPTAKLHISAGTSTAGGAPLKLTSGTTLTTPEDGAIEYDGTNLYFTDNTATRRALASTSSSSQSFSGDVTMSGAGTGLTVTNNATVGGSFGVTGTTTLSGLTNISGLTSLNGGATVAANQSFNMTSGTGQFNQTYSGAGPAHTITSTTGASGDLLDLTSTSTAAVDGDKAFNVSVAGANTSSTVTRYGVYSSVTATGTTSTNVGGYFSASGATNNYGLLVPNGKVGIGTLSPGSLLTINGSGTVLGVYGNAYYQNAVTVNGTLSTPSTANFTGGVNSANFWGNVGIGTTSPGNLLVVSGTGTVISVNGNASFNNNVTVGGSVTADGFYSTNNLTKTPTSTTGIVSTLGSGSNTDSGTPANGVVSNANVNYLTAEPLAATNTNVTYTNASTLYIAGPPTASTNVAITNPFALYSASGSNYFGGNVGIGTSSPSAPLEVLGTISSLGPDPIIRLKNSNMGGENRTYIGSRSSDGASYLQNLSGNAWVIRNAADSTDLVTFLNSGNVGIGSMTPGATLDIKASAATLKLTSTTASNAGITINGGGVSPMFVSFGNQKFIYSNPADTGAFYIGPNTTTTNAHIKVDQNGNVGIGTTSQGSRLEIRGATSDNTTSALNVTNGSGTSQLYVRNDGNVGIGTTSPAYSLDVVGIINTNNDITTSNSVRIGSDNNSRYIGFNGWGETLSGSNTSHYIKFRTNNNEVMRIDSSGNVGIGTLTAGYKLDVAGSINAQSMYVNGTLLTIGTGGVNAGFSGLTGATSTDTINNSNFAQTWNWSSATTENPLTLTANSLSTGNLLSLSSSSAALNSTSGLLSVANLSSSTLGTVARIQSNSTADSGLTVLANGNVGIGTNSPSANLHVVGNIGMIFENKTGSAYSDIKASTSSGTGVPIMRLVRGNGHDWSIGEDTSDTLQFVRDYTIYPTTTTLPSMVINSSGNVGVGTPSPGSRMEIRGATSDNTTSSLNVTNGSGTSQLFVRNDGYVGIGTTAPNSIFDVRPDPSFLSTTAVQISQFADNPRIGLYRPTGDGTNAYPWHIAVGSDTGTTSSFGIFTGNSSPIGSESVSPKLVINSSGNVGIGTTSPNAKLESQSTTEPLRLSYDPSHYMSFSVNSSGALNITGAAGSVRLNSGFGGLELGGMNIRGSTAIINKAGGGWLPYLTLNSSGSENLIDMNNVGNINIAGNVGIGTISPTAKLNISAGTSTAGGAPIKLTSGTTLSTPEAGAIEYDGTNLYFTDNTATRRALASTSSSSQSFSGDVTMSGAGTGLAVTNNATVGGTFGVTGTTTLSGLTNISGLTSLNGGATVAANQSFNMTSGTGQFNQTYSGAGPAHTITSTTGASGDLFDLTSTSTAAVDGDKAFNVSVAGANTSSTVTRYGVYSNVTATGTTSTNVGGYFSASGATNNYGLLVPNGNVGIGTISPNYQLTITNSFSDATQLIQTTAGTGSGTLYIKNGGGNGLTFSSGSTGVGGSSFTNFVNGQSDYIKGSRNLALGTTAAYPLGFGTNNVERLRIDSTGNVGVGTITPGSKMEIRGATSDSTTSALNVTNGSGTSQLLVRNDGNVGIGTTSPNSALQVAGNIFSGATGTNNNVIANQVLYGDSSTIGSNIGNIQFTRNHYDPAGVAAQISFYRESNANEGQIRFGTNPGTSSGQMPTDRLIIDRNGNVGIGTTTPATKLDVNGTIRIGNGNETCGSSYTGAIIYNGGNLQFCNGSSWATISTGTGGGGGGSAGFSGLTGATTTGTIDNANYAQTWNWSSATSQTPLTVTANSLSTGNLLSLSTTSSSLNSTNGLLNVANLSASTLGTVARIQANSTTAGSGLTVLANGNVGIGTISPTQALDVAGNINLNSSISFSGTAGVITNGTNTSRMLFGLNNGAGTSPFGGYFQIYGNNYSNVSQRGGAEFVFDTRNSGGSGFNVYGYDGAAWTNYFKVGTTGNVGIGTTSPVSKLHVSSPPIPTANYGTMSIGGAPFDGATSGYYTGSANGTSLSINELTGFTGNLIDTQVNGNSKFNVNSTGSIYYANSMNQMHSNQTSNFNVNNTTGTGDFTYFSMLGLNGSNQRTSGQQVGINIIPTYNQTASTAANTDLLINRTETSVGSGAQLLFDAQNGGVSKFKIDHSGNGYFAGNVGIGTTSPVTKLDVNGTIRVGNGGETCGSSYTGAIIYNGGNLQFCNGSSWATISTGTGGGSGYLSTTGGTLTGGLTANTITSNNSIWAGSSITGNGFYTTNNYQRVPSSTTGIITTMGGGGAINNDTVTATGATLSNANTNYFAVLPLTATNTGVTYTDAATMYIAGAPTASTNVSITNPYALYSASGVNYFGGPVKIQGTATNTNPSLNVNAGIDSTATGPYSIGNFPYLIGTGTLGYAYGFNTNSPTLGSASLNTYYGIRSGISNTAASSVNQAYYADVASTGAWNYGIDSEVYGAGTKNYGGYFSAKNATGYNYGVYISGGTNAGVNYGIYETDAQNYFGGNVGIGTSTPNASLHIYQATPTGTVTSSGTTVTGTGTNFTTALHVGDTLLSGGQNRIVTAIASDTSLTTSTAYSPTLSGSTFNRVAAFFNAGNVCFGSSTCYGLLSNANINPTNYPGSSGITGNSLNWSINSNGYAMGITNQSSASQANGLIIKTTGTLANNFPLTVIAGTSTNLFNVQGDGNVGIGTNSASYKLDVAGTLNAQSIYVNGILLSSGTGGGGSAGFSGLTGATTTGTIDNANFAQTWNWNSATTESPLALSANSLTTGNLLSLTSTSTSLNSTNGLLNVANLSASTLGTVARIQANSTAGSGLTVLANGNVGIGTTTPAGTLDINGALYSKGQSMLWQDTTNSNVAVSVGTGSGVTATSGTDLIAIGNSALNSNTTGYFNIAIGKSALAANTTGYQNNSLGALGLNKNTIGFQNNSFGFMTLFNNTTGNYNTAFGNQSMQNNTSGGQNTAVGAYSLNNINAQNNTAVGYASLMNASTNADGNTAVGFQAGRAITTGTSNLVLGFNVATTGTITGSNNILIGTSSAVTTGTTDPINNFLNIGNTLQGDLANGYIGIGPTNWMPTAPLHINKTAPTASTTSNYILKIDGITNSTTANDKAIRTFFTVQPGSGAGYITPAGIGGEISSNSAFVSNANIQGVYGLAYHGYNSTLGTATGISGGVNFLPTVTGGTINNAYAGYFTITNGTYAGDVINNAVGVMISAPSNNGAGTYGSYSALKAIGATVGTANFGVYITSATASGQSNFGLYQEGTAPNYFAGNVGIGTTTPNSSYKLDVAGSINAQSMYINGTLLSVGTGGGVNAGFSGLTGATATDTIDNTNFAQTWNWSSASTQTPLTVTANSLSTGNLLSLSSTSAALNSTNGLLSVANLSASTLGTVARIQSNSTAGSGLTVLANGNVGIGTTSPQAKLDVNGQIRSSVYNAGSGTSFDWNNGNLQYTSASCGAFTFSNMLEGGSYTLIVKGTTSGTCTFSQSSPDTLASGVFNFVPANGMTTQGTKTVFTFLRAGNEVFVSWISGY